MTSLKYKMINLVKEPIPSFADPLVNVLGEAYAGDD